ncbi:MAG: T9SS type A sorting domain-containing protein, partial [Formosa sp.]|nr:T9SS type A sorting domain-containing protein [Formosa sp.]
SPYYISIDDISIDLSPDCLMPTDLTVSDITQTTASASWTANNAETSWEYQVVESGVAPDATGDATSDNPLALTGLTSNTSYDVYVRANCGADGTSGWVTVSFTTPLATQTSFPYCSSFDTDLGDWSTEVAQGTSNWESASSSNNSVAAYSGGGSAYYYSGNYNGDSSVLISRPMDITALASPQVTFQIANPSWGADQDVLEVWYKATAADAWSVLGTYSDATTTFSEVTLNLPNASNDYYIAFNATSGWGYGVLIDDVCIAATSLGLEDVNTTSNFTYFPNPVNNVLSIKAQASIDSITVYNMLGQTVVRSTPNTTTTAVDMSGLQTGAYFVQVAINNSIETVRVIKN